jgi:hypothetical protein
MAKTYSKMKDATLPARRPTDFYCRSRWWARPTTVSSRSPRACPRLDPASRIWSASFGLRRQCRTNEAQLKSNACSADRVAPDAAVADGRLRGAGAPLQRSGLGSPDTPTAIFRAGVAALHAAVVHQHWNPTTPCRSLGTDRGGASSHMLPRPRVALRYRNNAGKASNEGRPRRMGHMFPEHPA